MRTERQMLDLIVGFAQEQEGVRAVVMNGSRVDPDAPRDTFQDYDIVYFVDHVAAYVENRAWLETFGELMIMQTPDVMEGGQWPSIDHKFTYLLQFADGNRIDLTFYAAHRADGMRHDSLSVVLLDKAGLLPELPPPNGSDYATAPPSAEQFAGCCNEFWWVSTYIAKGLWRRELSYAKHMTDHPVRDMLIRMLEWHIGVRSGFTASPGKLGKYFERHLEPRLWHTFVLTYADADYERMWDALFAMCGLFRETAAEVAAYFGYAYPFEDDRRVTAHLQHVRGLPRDAERMYG